LYSSTDSDLGLYKR